jgi:septal ring factor EnvC (AmiA/AmiB activator)
MTNPIQHNCPHSESGWCLKCVYELAEDLKKSRAAFQGQLNVIRMQRDNNNTLKEERDKLELENKRLKEQLNHMAETFKDNLPTLEEINNRINVTKEELDSLKRDLADASAFLCNKKYSLAYREIEDVITSLKFILERE